MGLVRFVLVAVLYFGLSKLSFLTSYAGLPAGPTPVWLPTGVSLAVVLICGRRVWPGLALGSILMTLTLGIPWTTRFALVLANVTEPLLASVLLERYTRFKPDFSRLRDVLALIGAGAILGSAASATIGISGLVLTRQLEPKAFPENWWDWWVANALSDLLLVPLIMVWRNPAIARPGLRLSLEFLAVSAASLAVTWLIFFSEPAGKLMPFVYWIYPVVIWLAVRVGFRATVSGVVMFSAVAIIATGMGRGPFFGETPIQSLIYVQAFLAITAVTGLVLAAVAQEARSAQEELRGSLQMRDEFLSIASHELKTPLSSLSVQIQVINRLIETDGLKNLDKQRQERLLGVSNVQMKRLTRLVNDLLDVSRITAGRLVPDLRPFDLSELVREIVDRYEHELKIAKCAVELELEASLRGFWDPMQTEQLFINLLTNAMKYGAGHPIRIQTRREGNLAIIVVGDQGIGISQGDQVRIFERFERAASIRSFGGLGLGLYIANQIAQSHGGGIRVESEVDRGSVFTVELPIRAA